MVFQLDLIRLPLWHGWCTYCKLIGQSVLCASLVQYQHTKTAGHVLLFGQEFPTGTCDAPAWPCWVHCTLSPTCSVYLPCLSVLACRWSCPGRLALPISARLGRFKIMPAWGSVARSLLCPDAWRLVADLLPNSPSPLHDTPFTLGWVSPQLCIASLTGCWFTLINVDLCLKLYRSCGLPFYVCLLWAKGTPNHTAPNPSCPVQWQSAKTDFLSHSDPFRWFCGLVKVPL